MSFYYSLREIKSLIEEGRRGLYKAAKLLKDVNPEDITQESLADFIEILEKIFEREEEQLHDIAFENSLKLISKFTHDLLNDLIVELVNSKSIYMKKLAGLTALRYSDKIDLDIVITVVKELLRNNELKFTSIAILKDIKKQIRPDMLSELLETIVKSEPIDLDLLASFLRFFSDKIDIEDLQIYMEYVFQKLNIKDKEKFKIIIKELKEALPKRIKREIIENLLSKTQFSSNS